MKAATAAKSSSAMRQVNRTRHDFLVAGNDTTRRLERALVERQAAPLMTSMGEFVDDVRMSHEMRRRFLQ